MNSSQGSGRIITSNDFFYAHRRRRQKGIGYGVIDEIGYAAVEKAVSIHDFSRDPCFAVLGIDAAKLTVKYQGRMLHLMGQRAARA